MAIIVQEEKNNSPLFITVTVVVVLAILGLATYYVFFKPTPGIEKAIISTEQQSVAQVSKVSFDITSVTDSPVYKSLRQQVGAPASALFGRQNPYARF